MPDHTEDHDVELPDPNNPALQASLDDNDVIWIEEAEEHGGINEKVNDCLNRWRNAGPEARKKMFALFAATGIFICICRHGHLLVICDMIRSGEL